MDKMEVINKRIREDAEFASLVNGAKTLEEKVVILKNAGYDVSLSDLKASGAALSDDDLDKVAGGIDSWK